MKRRFLLIAVLLLFVKISFSGVNDANQAIELLQGLLPQHWILTSNLDPNQFKPLRLFKAKAQLTLVEEGKTLVWDLYPGKKATIHPSIILFVYSAADLKEIEAAVQKEAFRSDCPPIIYGVAKRFVFVTSPGYINSGLHTEEAMLEIKELNEFLRSGIEIK